jgi:integrase/recombinase XerC
MTCVLRVILGAMLTIFRRHMKDCRFAAKGRKHRHCNCPLAVEGRLHGEMIRKSLDIRSWEAAQKLIRDWELGEAKADIPTIQEASKRFLTDLKSRGLSQETINKFKLLTDDLATEFPRWRVDRFTPDNVGKFREGWDVAPTTARKKLERLRSFFKFCVDRKWCDSNPASALRAPKETVIEKKPFDTDELEKIAWAIPLFPSKGIYGEDNSDRIKAFVSVLRWTGLRIRDVVQLKRSAVNEKYITVRTHKNGKPVQLPLHPDVREGLAKMNGVEYFFWSGTSNPKSCVGDWQRTLRRLGTIAGIHLHAHRFRHTFATTLLSKGVPVSEVAAILGNSPRIIEKHYSQWIQARQDSINTAVKATW